MFQNPLVFPIHIIAKCFMLHVVTSRSSSACMVLLLETSRRYEIRSFNVTSLSDILDLLIKIQIFENIFCIFLDSFDGYNFW